MLTDTHQHLPVRHLIITISLLPQARSQRRTQWGRVTPTLKAERNSPQLPSNQRTGGSACWGPSPRVLLPKPAAEWRSSVTRRRAYRPHLTWPAKVRGMRRKRQRQSGTTMTDWNRKMVEEVNRVGGETPPLGGTGGAGCTTAGLWSSSWRA